ncbi:MAG: multidrug efflux SMR transporter [Methylotenera sp.]|nr:multidrug efflux SMR transporter [Methylotenera sp.]
MLNWIHLSIAIIAEVIATSALKSAENFTRPSSSVIVVLGYVSAFYFLSLSLRTVPLAIAYAIWSGAGIAIIAIIGWTYYGQKVEISSIVGMMLIVTGIILLRINAK